MGVEAHFPEVIEPATGPDAAKSQDVFHSAYPPEHARLLAASADDGLAAGFDDSRTDELAPAAEGAILHARHVANKVSQFLFHRLGPGGAGAFLARAGDELFDLVPE